MNERDENDRVGDFPEQNKHHLRHLSRSSSQVFPFAMNGWRQSSVTMVANDNDEGETELADQAGYLTEERPNWPRGPGSCRGEAEFRRRQTGRKAADRMESGRSLMFVSEVARL